MLCALSLLLLLTGAQAHEYYDGRCPEFTPVKHLDWDRFKGTWEVAYKHSSRSSCIRYSYSGEGRGERRVTEEKLLPVLGRFGIPSAVSSSGTLTQTSQAGGDMLVKWDTGILRRALFSRMTYAVLATDYDSQALVCSCQDLQMGFTGVNRRSCDYLTRLSFGVPASLPTEYVTLLDRIDPDLALDMKRVRQDDCEDLKGPGINLGFWVRAGKAYIDSGLSYMAGLVAGK